MLYLLFRFRAKPSPSPTPAAHRKQVRLVNGIITVTKEQAVADTKEFYHANAVRDMEWHRRRAGVAGVADFASLR